MTIKFCCSPSQTASNPFTSPMEAVYKIFFCVTLRAGVLSSLLPEDCWILSTLENQTINAETSLQRAVS